MRVVLFIVVVCAFVFLAWQVDRFRCAERGGHFEPAFLGFCVDAKR